MLSYSNKDELSSNEENSEKYYDNNLPVNLSSIINGIDGQTTAA